MTHFFLSSVVILNAVDALFTVFWVEVGLAVEANPLMEVVMNQSPVLFALAKITLVNASVFLLWRIDQRRSIRSVAAFCAAVYYCILLFHLQFGGGLIGYLIAVG